MKMKLLILAVLLVVPGIVRARPTIEEQSKQAWFLSGEGTKPIECYFWASKTEVSDVTCVPLRDSLDKISIILPANATDLYHTHLKGFPKLSGTDKVAQRKFGIRIHVIHW